jgi:DinB superfamily
MKAKYNLLYKKEETFRAQLMVNLQQYSDEVLHAKPHPDAWSVADILAHLIARDEYEFNYISKKIKEGSPSEKTGFKARRRRLILKIAFILPIKFKVPEQVAPSKEYFTIKQLEARWKEIAKAKYELLNSLDESEFQKDVWMHPRVGELNFVQMIDFGIEHGKRHEKQIKNTLKSIQQNK